MPFAVAGAAVAAAGTAYAANQASSASKKGQNAAIAEQRRAEEVQRADVAPWRESGAVANRLLGDMTGLNGADAQTAAVANFRADPGYQYTVNQAMRGVESSAAASGMLRSGATLKALQDRAANLADQQWGNNLNRLMSISQMGQNAAAGQAGATGNAARDVSQSIATGTTQQIGISNQEAAGYQQAIKNAVSAYAGGGAGSIYGNNGTFDMNKAWSSGFGFSPADGGGKSGWTS